MLYGGVHYRLKANPESEVYVPWAGRVVFAAEKEGEGIKMRFYQVYLVSWSLFWFLSCGVWVCGADFCLRCRILRLSRGRNENCDVKEDGLGFVYSCIHRFSTIEHMQIYT
jgi:hypothetical protein